MRSLIDDIEELLALGKGDRYRLMDMRVRLENNKKLFISDREFLRNLVKNHLGRAMLSPEPGSRPTRPLHTTEAGVDVCTNCGSNIAADDMFCLSCGTKRAESGSAPSAPKPAQKLEDYEKEYLDRVEKHSKAEGFSIDLDGEVGKKTNRETARSKPKAKPETKPDVCTNCSFKMAIDEIFCINCGAKREGDSTLSAPKPIPQSKPKPKPKPETKPKPKQKPKPTARKSTKKRTAPVKKSRKEELEEYEKKYLKKVRTTKKSKPTVTVEETVDSPEGKKPKLSLCVRCGGVISEEEKFCTNCGSTR